MLCDIDYKDNKMADQFESKLCHKYKCTMVL